MVVTDPAGALSDFLRDFDSMLSRQLNALRGTKGTNFEKEPRIQIIADAQCILDKSVYSLTNPLAAHLVERMRQWKGCSSYARSPGGAAGAVRRRAAPARAGPRRCARAGADRGAPPQEDRCARLARRRHAALHGHAPHEPRALRATPPRDRKRSRRVCARARDARSLRRRVPLRARELPARRLMADPPVRNAAARAPLRSPVRHGASLDPDHSTERRRARRPARPRWFPATPTQISPQSTRDIAPPPRPPPGTGPGTGTGTGTGTEERDPLRGLAPGH